MFSRLADWEGITKVSFDIFIPFGLCLLWRDPCLKMMKWYQSFIVHFSPFFFSFLFFPFFLNGVREDVQRFRGASCINMVFQTISRHKRSIKNMSLEFFLTLFLQANKKEKRDLITCGFLFIVISFYFPSSLDITRKRKTSVLCLEGSYIAWTGTSW